MVTGADVDARTQAILEALNEDTVLSQHLNDRARKVETRKKYKAEVELYFAWARDAGLHPLSASVTDLNRYIREHVIGSELALNSRRLRYSILASFFEFVAKRWDVPSPMAHRDILPAPPPETQAPTVLSVDVFKKTMETAFETLTGGAALAVGLIGINGLKLAEVMAANVEDLTDPGDGHLRLALPTRGPDAFTELTGPVADLARECGGDRSHGPLVLNQAGRRINGTNIRDALNKIGRMVGTTDIGPQTLRSTAGALALAHGASATAVRTMLGISPRRLEAFVAYTKALPEEHAAARVLRIVSPGRTRNELLDQVDRLLADTSTHPIAPIAVTGAALEQHLRDACERHGLEVTAPRERSKRKGSEPGIDRYKEALRQADLLPPKTVTKVETWRDLRNDASHGRDGLTRDDAREMAAGVRRFIEDPL